MMNGKKLIFLVVSVALMLILVTSGIFGEGAKPDSFYRYLSVFTEVFSLVRTNYVDAVDTTKLVDGAFDGVTDAIDEFSYYVPPQEMKAYEEAKSDETTGMGLSISKRLGFAYVIAPVAGSPADEAGIRPGDFIERIDGKLTTDMPLWEIQTLLSGAHEQATKLMVVHAGATDRKEYDVTGQKFEIAEPTLDEIGGVARIKIPYFAPGVSKRVSELLAKVRESKSASLVVDVRGSGGGSMDEAISTADEFLSAGVITSTRGRRVEDRHWDATRSVDYEGRMVVLVDNSTAGPAEIFASAISGNGRGKTVGVNTYGKAIEQRFVKLPSGGGLNVTVAHFTRPDLSEIATDGVKPDVPVRLSMVDLGDDSKDESGKAKDPLLDRAVEALRAPDETVN